MMRGKLDLHGLERFDPIALQSEYTEEELEEFTFKTMCKVGHGGRDLVGRRERERRERGREGEKGEREEREMRESGNVILCAVSGRLCGMLRVVKLYIF